MTQADAPAVVWLTQAKYDELKAELENLRGPVLADVVEKLSAAREEGDLKENGGYHAAKDEQGRIQARIRQLEDMLKRAQVGETPPDDGVVEPGMLVTIRFAADSEEETFLLGAREMAGDDVEVYSPGSPLGSAINGRRKGEKVSYPAPNGKELVVEIVEAVPFEG